MSDEFRDLEDRINRMAQRKANALKVVADLQSIIASVDADIKAMELQLDALRYEGDSNSNNKEKK